MIRDCHQLGSGSIIQLTSKGGHRPYQMNTGPTAFLVVLRNVSSSFFAAGRDHWVAAVLVAILAAIEKGMRFI